MACGTHCTVPVHKKGITTDVSNYRPISLTCVLSKILERIVVGRLSDHLERNNILHPVQHGFIKHRSTCTNLLQSLNDWSRPVSVQSKEQVTIVYIDFTKDLVSHQKLPNYTLMVSVEMFYYGCRIFSLVVRYRQKSTPVCLRLRT